VVHALLRRDSEFEQQRRGAEFHPAEQYYTNNFADPDVMLDDGTYYAYGTSTGAPTCRS
jgi:hypothetical protein